MLTFPKVPATLKEKDMREESFTGKVFPELSCKTLFPTSHLLALLTLSKQDPEVKIA